MNKYLIITAFAIPGLTLTACGETCYECYDVSEGQVINDFCAADEDDALESADAFRQQQIDQGNTDVSYERI